jgi:hypothetical protein
MSFLHSVRGWFVAVVARAKTAADLGFFISGTSPVDSAWRALADDMEAGTVRVLGKAADHYTTGTVDGSGALTPAAVPASHATFDGATVLVKAPNGRAIQATAHFMAATGGAQPAIPMDAPEPGTVFPGSAVDYLGGCSGLRRHPRRLPDWQHRLAAVTPHGGAFVDGLAGLSRLEGRRNPHPSPERGE